MPIHKTVTDKKLAANRENAKRSTGPRTNRGKNIVRFNAATLGLFSKHVVIPDLDHAEPSDFDILVTSIVNELQPDGSLEVFYVYEIAKSMWRIRRASLAESGSARMDFDFGHKPPEKSAHRTRLNVTLKILQAAEEGIAAFGTLSRRAYADVVGLIGLVIPDSGSEKRLEELNSIGGTGTEIDIAQKIDPFFLAQLQLAREAIVQLLESRDVDLELWEGGYTMARAVAPQPILDNILRYEKTARRNLELAHRKLTELQTARRKTESSVRAQ